MKIAEIHNKVFDHLIQWSDTTNDGNKYFYLRTKNDERFRNEYWFPGDEHYVSISFWTGGDSLNKTPNVYLSIDPVKGIYGNLIARDSSNKKSYFSKLVNALEGYEPNKNGNVWRKKYDSFREADFINILQGYIDNDKKIIDEFLKATLDKVDEPDFQLLEDEYSSKFGFIFPEQFNKLRNRVESFRYERELNKKQVESDRNEKVEKGEYLPITISSIDIKNFQGIREHDSIVELPENAKWIFLTGENGFGKTSVLQAIALGLTKHEENYRYLDKVSDITIGYYKNGKFERNKVTDRYNEDFKEINNNFIGYGPLRLVTQASSSQNQESFNSLNTYNLFNKDGLLKNVDYLLQKSWIKKSKNEYENLKSALIKILNTRLIDINIDEEGIVKYTEADEKGIELGQQKLEHLATGFQGLINLTGDIITRYSSAFPDLAFDKYEGIIIIDELENHLHPVFQKQLPSLLSSVFQKLQFICSIHSPIPLLGALPNSVILNINRNAEDGITIERIDQLFDFNTLNPNIILTSPIFGFKDIFPLEYDGTRDRIKTDDFYDDDEFRKVLKRKLDDYLKKDVK